MILLINPIVYPMDTLQAPETLPSGNQTSEYSASAVADTGLGQSQGKSFLTMEPVLTCGKVSGSMRKGQCMGRV